ncbi:hypothetical protein diail_8813 [Diaporthe ilicicola]|nr:hypothetical protein diail_8813 [Diaporthe ilicicola]
MARFHHFSGLPRELRDPIWDMAIRDGDPTVHFFTLYDHFEDSDSVVDPAKKVHVISETCSPFFDVGFAAPRSRGSDQLSWTDGNISTYLSDSGLWTACKESRERMLKYFKPFETSPLFSKRKPLNCWTVYDIRDQLTTSINMEYTRDSGERQYLTIRPITDLICLQRPEGSNISWSDRGLWQLIANFPSFRWYSEHNLWGLSNLRNVAVEYNPAWEFSDRNPDYEPFMRVTDGFSKVDEIHGLHTFWLIDYRLTRKYKSADCERQTFRAGALTFIEVDRSDYEWCCCPKERCLDDCFPSYERYKGCGPHALIDGVESYNEYQFDGMSGHSNLNKNLLGADMRVLACVELELEGELPTREEWWEMNDERIERLYQPTYGRP